MPERTFGWQTLCKAAILEINPDKLAICDRGGRAGHRSTRTTSGYYRTRASQVGGRPFNAQDPEQDFHAVRGNTFQARSELCFRERSAGGIACSWCCERYRQRLLLMVFPQLSANQELTFPPM